MFVQSSFFSEQHHRSRKMLFVPEILFVLKNDVHFYNVDFVFTVQFLYVYIVYLVQPEPSKQPFVRVGTSLVQMPGQYTVITVQCT